MAEENIIETTTDPAEPRTFTQEETTALCAKEAGKAERAILKAFGIKDKSEIQELLDKLSNAEETKNSLSTVTTERDQYKEKYESTNTAYIALQQKSTLAGYGVTDPEEQEFLAFKIGKMVDTETDFATAATAYFKDHPMTHASVKLNVEGGDTPKTATLNEIINKKLRGEI